MTWRWRKRLIKRKNPRCDEGQYVEIRHCLPNGFPYMSPDITRNLHVYRFRFPTRFQISFFSYTAFRVSKLVFRFRFSAPRFSVFTRDREIQPLYLFNFWSVTKSVTLREKWNTNQGRFKTGPQSQPLHVPEMVSQRPESSSSQSNETNSQNVKFPTTMMKLKVKIPQDMINNNEPSDQELLLCIEPKMLMKPNSFDETDDDGDHLEKGDKSSAMKKKPRWDWLWPSRTPVDVERSVIHVILT